MKISQRTKQLLKNFSGINSNLMLKSGSTLSTINSTGTIYASVNIDEDIPLDFGIYDLNQLLSSIALFDDPDVIFSDNFLTIRENKSELKFGKSPPEIIEKPKKEIVFPPHEVSIHLTQGQIHKLMTAARTLNVSDMSITSDGGDVTAMVFDIKNPSSNKFEILISQSDVEFAANFKTENMKMIAGDYDIDISSRGIARFRLVDDSLYYYLALEKSSSFGDA